MSNKPIALVLFTFLLVLSLACTTLTALTSGGDEEAAGAAETSAPPETGPTPKPPQPGGGPPGGEPPPPPGKPSQYDTVFPLPEDVQNFVGEGGEGQVNFQTSLGLEEVMDFYRREFTRMGLTERTLLTVTSEATFSMVFDGWPNGKAIVVQGVSLGPGSTNVNIRFEDV